MTQLGTWQPCWKQHCCLHCNSVRAMHIKHTRQEDAMPKEFIQDCIFWHTFTFTCHDTSVYPGCGKSERKPAEGTGNTGPTPSPLGTNAKGWMNSTVSEPFLSKDFPFPPSWRNNPMQLPIFQLDIFLSFMPPHTLLINCITTIQKINPNHF